MVTIVDYKLGNLGSLCKAFEKVGIEYIISDDKEILQNSKTIILPGVGAFRDAIEFIDSKGIGEIITEHVKKGGYLIGICLGMQLLYEKSYENGSYDGLALLDGEIVKLESKKIPHMGWNNLNLVKDDDLVRGLTCEDYVYFVHSYYAKGQTSDTVAYADYDNRIPSVVRKDNIIGFQFHPEKSGKVGETILKNLSEVIK